MCAHCNDHKNKYEILTMMWVLGEATVKAHTLQTLAPEFSPSGLCRKLCKRLPVQPQVIGEASSCFLCASVCTNTPLSGRDHVHYGYFGPMLLKLCDLFVMLIVQAVLR